LPRLGLHGLIALSFLACTSRLNADDSRPLVWAADLDGGIPYVFQDADGNLAGFEVDIKDALARVLGRPVVFKQYAFNSLLSGLERGDFDFALNGLEITPEREQQARFSRPYYIYQQQLVARRDDRRFQTLAECKEQGLSVATLDGSAAMRLLLNMDVRTKLFEDQLGPYTDLAQGAVDAVLLDVPVALYYAIDDPHLRYAQRIRGLRFAGQPFAEGYYGIAVRRDNQALAEQLDQALAKLIDSGELRRILTRWELWNPDQYRLATVQLPGAGSATSVTPALYMPLLLEGAAWTIALTLASMMLAIALGLPIAFARLYGPAPLRWLATCYVEFFRGIPVLLLLYFVYFGIPGVFPQLKLDPFTASILGFGLTYAAYEAEIYRAGISAIPDGQWEAAASLGMSSSLTFRRIIFPQSFRIILPPMTNDLIALFKDTSVVSVISVVELSKQYQILTKTYGGFVQIGLATALLYLVMSVPLGYLSRYLERRWGGLHP
jgi:polar amino acid transport system substrate-binding protein